MAISFSVIAVSIGGDLAPSLEGTETIFRRPNFRMTFFRTKIFILTPSILVFRLSTIWNLIYTIQDPFLNEKPLFHNKKFLHLTFLITLYFSRTSLNTTSPNICGTDACAVPPPQILGRTVPQFPLSLRPWPLAMGYVQNSRSGCQY